MLVAMACVKFSKSEETNNHNLTNKDTIKKGSTASNLCAQTANKSEVSTLVNSFN